MAIVQQVQVLGELNLAGLVVRAQTRGQQRFGDLEIIWHAQIYSSFLARQRPFVEHRVITILL